MIFTIILQNTCKKIKYHKNNKKCETIQRKQHKTSLKQIIKT